MRCAVRNGIYDTHHNTHTMTLNLTSLSCALNIYLTRLFIVRIFYFAVIITTLIAVVSSLRIVMLDIPSPAMAGESVELMCSYELENDRLYSIKW